MNMGPGGSLDPSSKAREKDAYYELLPLSLIPLGAILGNILVITSVVCERHLRTSTNLLLVSLAAADLLIALTAMPASLYSLVNKHEWVLPEGLCTPFLLFDVAASTASIVHMVAVAVDRCYAVVCHLKYRTRSHQYFVLSLIVMCWVFSALLTVPVLFFAQIEDDRCLISNSDFMLYGSLFGFYIPCLVMIMTYGFVFHRLRRQFVSVRVRELAAAASTFIDNASGQPKRPSQENIGTMLSVAHGGTDALRRNTLTWAMPFLLRNYDAETFLDDTDSVSSGDLEELTTILLHIESTSNSSSNTNRPKGDRKEYRPPPTPDPAVRKIARSERAGSLITQLLENRKRRSLAVAAVRLRSMKTRAIDIFTRLRTRQGKAIRKETKATKLVLVVLVAFLICWTPFFSFNVYSAYMIKSSAESPPNLDNLFGIFTWLGYFNSCLNPIIYCLLNKRFRTAFRRYLFCLCYGLSAQVADIERRREKSERLRELHARSITIFGGESAVRNRVQQANASTVAQWDAESPRGIHHESIRLNPEVDSKTTPAIVLTRARSRESEEEDEL